MHRRSARKDRPPAWRRGALRACGDQHGGHDAQRVCDAAQAAYRRTLLKQNWRCRRAFWYPWPLPRRSTHLKDDIYQCFVNVRSVIVHHSVGVCLGLSHQLFAGVIKRRSSAAFFADVASVGGCLFSEVASIMAATVIMTMIMLYEMIMVLIMPSHKRGSEENGEAGVCLFMAGRVAGAWIRDLLLDGQTCRSQDVAAAREGSSLSLIVGLLAGQPVLALPLVKSA
jgi:hypothetical protein